MRWIHLQFRPGCCWPCWPWLRWELPARPEQLRPPHAAAASVAPQVQYLNDTTGTVFTFPIHNTGTSTSIGAVGSRPALEPWTIVGCPLAPAGWTATRSDTMCRYRSADGTADDIKPGQSSSAFR